MNETLLLSLQVRESTRRLLGFRLNVENLSEVKLLFPVPRINQLRFLSDANLQECKWRCASFVSAKIGTFALRPAASQEFEFSVRPSDIERPAEREGRDHGYWRWSVDLPFGEYQVWFQWRVSTAFYDPDTHVRWKDLECIAQDDRAELWYGEALSNRLRAVRPLI